MKCLNFLLLFRMKPKYPWYLRRHLAWVMSYGARLCKEVIISVESQYQGPADTHTSFYFYLTSTLTSVLHMEEAGFLTYTAASHQGAIKMFCLHTGFRLFFFGFTLKTWVFWTVCGFRCRCVLQYRHCCLVDPHDVSVVDLLPTLNITDPRGVTAGLLHSNRKSHPLFFLLLLLLLLF